MKTLHLAVISFACLSQSVLAQTPTEGVRDIEKDQGGQCQSLINFSCATFGYPMTYFPNFRNHENQNQAASELFDYFELIDSRCSDFIHQFLCGFYFPFCFTSSEGIPTRIRPCKSLCEAARQNCSEVLMANSDLQWPDFLNCSLDTFPCDGSIACFGPNDISPPASCIETTTTGGETTIVRLLS